MANFTENKSKLKKLSLLGIIILCLSFVAILSSLTLSWLTDESKTSNGEPNITYIGELDLTCTTNFKFSNLALAPDTIYTTDQSGKDIATYIKTSNIHNIDGAYVRIKFETYRKSSGSDTRVNNLDLLDLYFDGNLTSLTTYNDSTKDHWFYNDADGYYYFIGGVYYDEVKFNAGYKTSNIMTNLVAGQEVIIDFTIECIQRQYGASASEWTTAPQIFSDMAEVESQSKYMPAQITASVTIDGTSSSVTLKTGLKLSESLAQAGITSVTDSNSCGWFADEDCTMPISNDTVVKSDMKLYTKSATLDKLSITTNSSGQKTVTKLNTSISGEIVIPNDVEIIDSQAFAYLNVTKITIPTSVTTINRLAIIGTRITSLHIPKSVTSIDVYIGSPSTLSSITIDPDNTVFTDGSGNCIINKTTKTLLVGCKKTVVPSDEKIVTTIGEFAFRYNGEVTKLHIPANITNIGLGFLINNITDISVASSSLTYKVENGYLIDKTTNSLHTAGANPGQIPSNIQTIKSYCFFSKATITTNLILPSTLTKIESGAFSNFGGTQIYIYIPSTVTTISSNTFGVGSLKVTIYTDVASASAHPTGWHASMLGTSTNITINYGYTVDQFKSELNM